MIRKKLIFVALFSLLSIPLCGRHLSDTEIQKKFGGFLKRYSNSILDGLRKNAQPKELQKALEHNSDMLDKKNHTDFVKELKLNVHEQKYAPKIQKFINTMRKKNQSKENYAQTKKNIKEVYLACIKNNSKKKTECQRLANAYSKFVTGIDFATFLASPQKTKGDLFFEELDAQS